MFNTFGVKLDSEHCHEDVLSLCLNIILNLISVTFNLVADEFDVQAETDLRREKQVPVNDISRIHRPFSSSRNGSRVSSRMKMKHPQFTSSL